MARLQLVLKVFLAALAVLLPLTLAMENCRAEEPAVIHAQTGTVKGRAIEAINAGNFTAAIDILEKDPSQDLFDDDYKALLAKAYGERGWKKQDGGDFSGALEDLKKARLNEPKKQFSTYFGLAYCSYRLKQADDALDYLDEAIFLEPSEPQSRTLKGEIYYQRGRLREAVSEWELALQAKPGDKGIKDLLARARKELGVEGSFTDRETYYFNVKYEGEEERQLGDLVLDVLYKASSNVGGDLGYYQKEPINVILYTRQQFVDVTNAPDWSGGIFDGNIRIPVGGREIDKTALAAVLHHEFTHAVIHREVSGHVPAWLDEGTAQYEERWARQPKADGFTPVPLSTLDATFINMDPEKARNAYAESLSAVQYYVDRFGMYSLSNLIKDMGEGRGVSDAMKEAAGVSLSEFEQDWLGSTGR
ncbi:MAG: tetratricopeptide repeat protein [Nitrospirota bacterium]